MSQQVTVPKLPAMIASRYVPIRLIGRGGMGMVYEVEHTRTGEHLALKVLLSTVDPSADALERFKREARASARIRSENVVRVTDAGIAPELDGAPFLVMELLEGMDLEKAASAQRPTPATVVDWLRQVARAIDKAHRIGIVHRDLKPENLFLANFEDRAPMVKVLDFGIAKMAQEGTGATGSGQVLGTPKYMAPEQAAGNARVSPATDLYAMGLIAYRLILGENYYQDDNVMSTLGALLHGQLQPPSARNPRFGPAFDDWFRKACHREPAGRFASAAIQVEALAEALGLPTLPMEAPRDRSTPGATSPIDATPTLGLRPGRVSAPAPLAYASGPTRSNRGVLALAAAAVIVVVIAALFVFRSSSANRREEQPVVPSGSAVTPSVSVPVATDKPPTPAPSIIAPPAPVATPPPAPAATAGAAGGTAKKSRAAIRAPSADVGTKPPASPAADPFRDQK